MKKYVALLLLLVTVASLFVGCKKEESKKTLTVATSPDFAPMEFVDVSKSGQDQFVGFDISLAKYIAQELDMELVITPMSFDSCELAVSSGQADIALAGFSWKADRAANYNLSDYYYAGDNESEQVVIVLKENAGKFTTPEDFAGQIVAAQIGSLQADLCNDQLPDAEIQTIGDLNTALLQLQKGDFLGLAVAKGQAEVFIANHDDVALSGFAFEVDPAYVGNVVLIKKGNDELTEKINEILAKAEAAGLYGQWYAEAEELAGSANAKDISYDDDGNEVTTTAGE